MPGQDPSAGNGARRQEGGQPPWQQAREQLRAWWAVPVVRRTTIAVTAVVVAPVALLALVFAYYFLTADVPTAAAATHPDPTQVLDASGKTIGQIDPTEVGRDVDVSALPDHVVHAVLAAEDRDFYGHGGISVAGTTRAFFANLRSGAIEQGASTIDQQYVGLVDHTGRSYLGKLREAATALRLDDRYPKDRILQMYLNSVPFGRQANGIDAAARTFFAVPATKLDVNQAATLAGMIAAPSAYDPEQHPDRTRKRRDYVLDGMATKGWIDRTTATEVASSPLPKLSAPPTTKQGSDAYFVDAVRSQLPDLLGDRYSGDVASGLVVHTTIDARLQQLAQQTLRERISSQPDGGAIVSVEPATGAVRALVGGTDPERQRFNAATKAVRQPGSSFKPVTLAAFVAAGNSPKTRFKAPETYPVQGSDGEHEIHNYSGHGWGVVDVHKATVHSINTVYMQLAEKVGLDQVVQTAHDLGIRSDLPAVPTLALGAGGVTPLELSSVYATLAAQGVHRGPFLVTKVETPDGEVLYEHETTDEPVLDQNTAAVVTDTLTDVVRSGTGTAADIGRPVAGKTGTTNDYRDAWFAGYVPQLATVVWVGNLDNSPMDKVTGGSLPAEVWSAYMSQALQGVPVQGFPAPDLAGLSTSEGVPPPPPPPPSPAPAPSPSGPPSPSASPSPSTSPTVVPTAPTTSPSPSSSPSSSPSPSGEATVLPGSGDG